IDEDPNTYFAQDDEVVHDQDTAEERQPEDSTVGITVSTAPINISTARETTSTGGRVVYGRRSKEARKDKGKEIMTEPEPEKKSKKLLEQERLGLEEAIRLQEKVDEEERAQVARDEEISRQLLAFDEERVTTNPKTTNDIDWNDPSVQRYWDMKNKPKLEAQARKNMIVYLKNQSNYRMKDFDGMSYDEIRPIFEKVWDFNHNFVPMDLEIEKEKKKPAEFQVEQIKKDTTGKRKKSLPRKRTKSTTERQKVELDDEKEDLKGYLDIVPREDIAVDVDSLSTKQDIVELYKLIKERYSSLKPEGYDLMLWGDLHTLFEPDEESEIWMNQNEYNLISWSLCDFCGVHILLMQNGIAIHMLTEKKYPLSQEMISKMLSKRLEVDQESTQAYELLKFIRSQVKKYKSYDSCRYRKKHMVQSGVQTRRMIKTTNEQGFISVVYEGKTYKDLHTCLFASFITHEDPKKVIQALKDPSWIEAMQEELLQFKLQQVWTLVDLPHGKRAIGTKWVYRNKKDERGIEAIRKFCLQPLGLQVTQKDDGIFTVKTRPDIMFDVCACTRFQVTPKSLHIHAVKRIFKYLKGQPKLGLWYLKDSPFDLEAYMDSGYVGGSNEKKLIQMIKIHTDQNVADLLTKAFDVSRLEYLIATANDEIQVSTIGLTYYYALTVNPTIYTSCVKQFWATAKAKTVNGEVQIQALVDGKKVIVTKTCVRRALHLKDAEGTECLPNATIFEQLTLMGPLKLQRLLNLMEEVKKLEKGRKIKNSYWLKRLRKVGRSAQIVSSEDEGLGAQEDASKQGRKIADLDVDAEVVSTAEVTTVNATMPIVDELTLAQTLIEIKAAKPKAVTTAATITTTAVTRPKARGVAKDKGKKKMVEPEKPLKRKDQILIDEEIAQKLQAQLNAELEEEEKLAKQREEDANIVEWDNVQAMIDANYELAARLQTQE
ncbi:hypothetical protein Tco_0897335, partial [Tanacetum coccineum]